MYSEPYVVNKQRIPIKITMKCCYYCRCCNFWKRQECQQQQKFAKDKNVNNNNKNSNIPRFFFSINLGFRLKFQICFSGLRNNFDLIWGKFIIFIEQFYELVSLCILAHTFTLYLSLKGNRNSHFLYVQIQFRQSQFYYAKKAINW